MTVTKRYLVLNAQNEVQRPCDFGLSLAGFKDPKSPSALTLDAAKGFADQLAKRSKGTSYYVAEVLAGTIQHTEPVQPGEWVDAAQ